MIQMSVQCTLKIQWVPTYLLQVLANGSEFNHRKNDFMLGIRYF